LLKKEICPPRLKISLDKRLADDFLLKELEAFIIQYKQKKQETSSPSIPLSAFAAPLGILETIVKYLKENLDLPFHTIADILNRDDRTIWAAYNSTKRKHAERLSTSEEQNYVPVTIFVDRHLGPLEAITFYLRNHVNLSYKEISVILHRDYCAIWLSYRNAMQKLGVST
jgi:hypothetical protein